MKQLPEPVVRAELEGMLFRLDLFRAYDKALGKRDRGALIEILTRASISPGRAPEIVDQLLEQTARDPFLPTRTELFVIVALSALQLVAAERFFGDDGVFGALTSIFLVLPILAIGAAGAFGFLVAATLQNTVVYIVFRLLFVAARNWLAQHRGTLKT